MPGDALVVRGGRHLTDEWSASEPLPGMTVDAVRWMHDHGIAVYAGDIGDAHPPLPGEVPGALHRFGLGRLAIPLIDGCDPTELAGTCTRLGRWTFQFIVAVPRFTGTTGHRSLGWRGLGCRPAGEKSDDRGEDQGAEDVPGGVQGATVHQLSRVDAR
ncbi:hypothetical protein [Actinoplanes sp. CA-252034]|uniref:hypothetical protein n=1 Tax=Actinoplanes sp. CA-252034 TaxID=3239906 RepID=UPI003D978EF1